ncbi:hypothetical protein T484DRAFT_1777726, partial [Baffinella frigidus]
GREWEDAARPAQVAESKAVPVLIDDHHGTHHDPDGATAPRAHPHSTESPKVTPKGERGAGGGRGSRGSTGGSVVVLDRASVCTPWAEDMDDSSGERRDAGLVPDARLSHSERRALERRSVSESSFGGAVHLEPLEYSRSHARVGGRRSAGKDQAMVVAGGQQEHSGVVRGAGMVLPALPRGGASSREEVIKHMGVEQVAAWLAQVGLEESAHLFLDARVDGAGLLQLRELQAREVEVFYASVQARIGLTKFGQ